MIISLAAFECKKDTTIQHEIKHFFFAIFAQERKYLRPWRTFDCCDIFVRKDSCDPRNCRSRRLATVDVILTYISSISLTKQVLNLLTGLEAFLEEVEDRAINDLGTASEQIELWNAD